MRVQIAGGLLVLALGSGCSDRPEQMCTLIGGVSGVSVTVASDLAPISRLALELCQDGLCREYEVELRDRMLRRPSDCAASGRPDRCRALQAMAGTQSGYVSAEVPSGDLEVRARYERDG